LLADLAVAQIAGNSATWPLGTIELVASELGLGARQVMIPPDDLGLD
jgi:hypothetical protein